MLSILYRDDDLVIVDKPAAMLTHVHQFDRTSPNVCAVLERKLGVRVYTVHRLDRMTTGLLVVALNPVVAHRLSGDFFNRRIHKRYLALVRGHTGPEFVIATPLEKNGRPEEAESQVQTIDHGFVSEAVGRYPEAWFSLVQVKTLTGRRHQIRRHLHSINHPVIGDRKHGDKNYNAWAENRFEERYLYLRATELAFEHPGDGSQVQAVAALPAFWRQTLEVVCPESEAWRSLPADSRVDTMQAPD